MKPEKYDVVIVGSGIGGMCSGALLAHAGFKVLVLERLSVPGGRFSTRPYRGYKLSTGGQFVEMGGPVAQVFEEVGAELDVRVTGGVSVHMHGQFHEMPEKGKLQKQIELAGQDEKEVQRVLAAIGLGMRWMEPSARINFREWLSQYTQNENILGLFKAFITGFSFLNDDELPADLFFKIVKTSPWRSMGVCPKGNIGLMESLAKVIKDKGGDVRTQCPVKRILSEKGIVTGVIAQHDGKELKVSARAVISNAGPRKTVELAGPENFDNGYLKELREMGPPAAQAWIWFSSDRPLMDEATPLCSVTDARRLNGIMDITAWCPELAPPGRRLFVAGGSPGSSFLSTDYVRETEMCVQDLRDIFPTFDKHAELLLPQYYRGEWPGYQAWPGRGLPEKTPLVHLYNVGDGVNIPGTVGTTNAAQSARLVVEDLKRRLK